MAWLDAAQRRVDLGLVPCTRYRNLMQFPPILCVVYAIMAQFNNIMYVCVAVAVRHHTYTRPYWLLLLSARVVRYSHHRL